MSQFMVYLKSGRNSGRNFCANPVNPVPAGFENFKSGAPLLISLLDFTLSNSFFTYKNTTYKQIHGCAMGSPVSPVIANLYMEEIEERAIANTANPPKVWHRYVDDVLSVMKKDAISTFHDELNSIDPHISFTIEYETNGQIAFLDTLISRNSGSITTDVYRKPTHTYISNRITTKNIRLVQLQHF